jgi:enoyl-CoA hydratase/carnithine racemase
MSIHLHTHNGVATLEIARPEKKNALSIAMYESMTSALQAAHADDAVRALLITGQPGVFTVGNDLEDFVARPPTGEDAPVYQFMSALLAFEKPVVAAVTGTAIGIGMTMLLHCDLVYVAADAKLALPFVSLGLVPEFGSSLAMPRLMGHVRAAEKLMLGAPFTGEEAVQLGIANAALPAGEVLTHARRIAERFNDLPPIAVRETKRLLRAKHNDHVVRAMRDEAAVFLERLGSPEAKHAFEAFFRSRNKDPESPAG